MSSLKPVKKGQGDTSKSQVTTTPPPSQKEKKKQKQKRSSSLRCLWISAILLIVLCPPFYYLDTIKHKAYIFDQHVLHKVAQDAIKAHPNNTQKLIDQVVTKLNEKYPGHILKNPQWVFNNAGGAMGALLLLHASITEYVIIFGTPVGTEGHTGRYLADDYFIILQGEQWAFYEGQLDREVYKPGEMHHLPRGQAGQYKMPDKCWALEYARGWIPLMLPFGVADTFTSTLDFVTLGRTFWLYTQAAVQELLQGKL